MERRRSRGLHFRRRLVAHRRDGISDKGDGRAPISRRDLRHARGRHRNARRSRRQPLAGDEASAWLVEAEHHGALDVLAYARSVDADFGLANKPGRTRAPQVWRRRPLALSERFSVLASAWYDDSLTDASTPRGGGGRNSAPVIPTAAGHRPFRRPPCRRQHVASTVLEGAVSQRLLDNRLELSAPTSLALGRQNRSICRPATGWARVIADRWLRVLGTYEIADGRRSMRARSPGSSFARGKGAPGLDLGRRAIAEQGKRSFAAFGLSRPSPLTPADARRHDGRQPQAWRRRRQRVVNPLHPVASGGHLTQDGALFEDFTAVTLGAAWRHLWAATARGENRSGEYADRAASRSARSASSTGSVVGSGFTWTRAQGNGGSTEIFDGAISAAFRPAARSRFSASSNFAAMRDRCGRGGHRPRWTHRADR